MRVNLPGYYSETLPSGTVRHVVRKEGEMRKKTTIPVGPDQPDFLLHYEATRRGEKYFSDLKTTSIPKSLTWLMDEFEAWMEKRVASGLLHSSTLHQRRQFYARLRPRYAGKHMQMPSEVIARIRDEMMDTPGAADNMVKALRAMYSWACQPERRILRENPAIGLESASQYHIVAVHGHSDAKTSQVYTESVDRQRLASQAMDLLAGMEWSSWGTLIVAH